MLPSHTLAIKSKVYGEVVEKFDNDFRIKNVGDSGYIVISQILSGQSAFTNFELFFSTLLPKLAIHKLHEIDLHKNIFINLE